MKHSNKIAILLAAALAAGTIAGCGSSKIGKYEETVAATYGSEKIYLDEANFWLRYQQIMSEASYSYMYTYFGYENMWQAPANDGTGTMADYITATVMKQIDQTRVLNDHMADYNIELTEDQKTKIKDAVSNLHENFPNFSEVCDVDDARIEEWMTANATANLVAQAIKKEAAVEVTDDECKMYGIEYITVSEPAEEETSAEAEETSAAAETTAVAETTAAAEESAASAEETTAAEEETTVTAEVDDASAETTEEAGPQGEELAQIVLKQAEAGTDFDAIASDNSLTSSTENYLLTGETSEDIKYTTSKDMAVGEVKQVYEEGTGWILIKKTNDYDEDATNSKREELTNEKENEAFDAKYAELAKSAPKFKVNNKIWSQITVSDYIYQQPTEAAEETGADVEETTATAEVSDTAAEETTVTAEVTEAPVEETTATAEVTEAPVEETTATAEVTEAPAETSAAN